MLNTTRHSLSKTIALATLLAGTLDLLDALIFYGIRGVQPIRILQSIASGLLGRIAFSGGVKTALIGLLIHFAITLFWSALFILLATRLPALSRHAIPAGLLYGALIYLVMNYVVLPLTPITPLRHPAGIALLNGVAALMFCIGLPITLVHQRLSPGSRVSS